MQGAPFGDIEMSELHPETQENVGHFVSDVIRLLGERLKRAVARVSNPRAGTDPMADVDVLLVADDLATREMYRIWELAGEASIRYNMIFSVQAYSTTDFEARKGLPAISVFLAEGLEYDLQ
jgi:hypothetical protein